MRDELNATLRRLIPAAGQPRVAAKNILRIEKPQGDCFLPQARGCNARNGKRVIRAQNHQPAMRIRNIIKGFQRHTGTLPVKHVEELQGWRDHAVIAPCLK